MYEKFYDERDFERELMNHYIGDEEDEDVEALNEHMDDDTAQAPTAPKAPSSGW